MVSDLLSGLMSDADLKLSAGEALSGISLNNNGQFKSLLYTGLSLRLQQASTLQGECREMAESLLTRKRVVQHLESIVLATRRAKIRRRLAVINEEWVTRGQEGSSL
ncbi:hypothetical protein [Parendozoicomonas sp. Alg238-R29]|uniref:hypothetical protein n=1 Tax=Parendozoicomonas sp. Alg238-R29 TaxID=2993446 RepID=UPI00248F3FC4|nr:hypothetical protein [Parendozoicomonas sp. Alg238-R29]